MIVIGNHLRREEISIICELVLRRMKSRFPCSMIAGMTRLWVFPGLVCTLRAG
jgi:hypothetical protein